MYELTWQAVTCRLPSSFEALTADEAAQPAAFECVLNSEGATFLAAKGSSSSGGYVHGRPTTEQANALARPSYSLSGAAPGRAASQRDGLSEAVPARTAPPPTAAPGRAAPARVASKPESLCKAFAAVKAPLRTTFRAVAMLQRQLASAAASTGPTTDRLRLITCGALPAAHRSPCGGNGGARSHLARSPLAAGAAAWGVARVAAIEAPQIKWSACDVSLNDSPLMSILSPPVRFLNVLVCVVRRHEYTMCAVYDK